MDTAKTEELCAGLNDSACQIYNNNADAGFWDKPRNVGEMLMLVVSELGEALEADRKNLHASLIDGLENFGDDAFKAAFELCVKDTFQDEIADAIIRLLDLSAGLNVDIETHIRLKVRYNTLRGKLHGKKY